MLYVCKLHFNLISLSTDDIVLLSIVAIEGLENITISGHGNPVVKCNDAGAVKFISCKNVTWKGCGFVDYPGIEFYNSSNFFFKSAHSITPKAKVFLNVVNYIRIALYA